MDQSEQINEKQEKLAEEKDMLFKSLKDNNKSLSLKIAQKEGENKRFKKIIDT